jgi:fructosamine-3-kinase
MGGGDVGQVWDVDLADGRRVVVKRAPSAAELEAEGLRALRDAGASVPAVLAVEGDLLVLDHVDGAGDPERFGRMLATVHTTTGPAFGWTRDNVIGPLPQANPWTEDWADFLAEHRIGPHLDVLPPELARRIDTVVEDGTLARTVEHGAPASLVHGDLWAGNVLGWRWMIDPAVHHADREVDLAMLDLFGSIPPAAARGYAEVWPLDDGWERRRDVLQLVPLLIHVRLFGSGYLGGIVHRLDRLGW